MDDLCITMAPLYISPPHLPTGRVNQNDFFDNGSKERVKRSPGGGERILLTMFAAKRELFPKLGLRNLFKLSRSESSNLDPRAATPLLRLE